VANDAAAFNKRSLKGTDYVYCRVDGIHLKVRLEQEKVCLLVMIGVRADGKKEVIAVSDGFRESSESWADLLLDCKRWACGRRSWPSVTEPWGSGRRCARSSRHQGAEVLVPRPGQRGRRAA
jgi:Transposase, Mutator family